MIKFLYKPTPRQKLFHTTFAKHKLYGGSAGGGKTDGLLGELLINCMRYPGIKQLFIRKTYSEITEILDERLKKFIESDNGMGYERSRAKNMLRFAGGEIILGYWNGNRNTDKYFSMEYDVIAIDEITRTIYNYQDFEKLCSRNRSSKKDLKAKGFEPYIMCGTNPGGPGHGYIKELFIDGEIPEGFSPEHFKFIPAKIDDNPHLIENDPFYKIRLQALSDQDLKRALLDGDRDIFEGKFWTEFYKTRHVVDAFNYSGGVKRSILCLDYGYTAPSAVYKISLDNDKKSFISNEIYETKLDYHGLGRKIKATFIGHDDIECIVADPAIFTKSGNVESGAEIIQKESGYKVVRGNNDRIPGRSKIRELYRDNMINIHSTCKHLIEETTNAIHDDKKDGDLDSKKDDHAMDAVRYGEVYLYGYGTTLKDISNVNDSLIKKNYSNVLNTQF